MPLTLTPYADHLLVTGVSDFSLSQILDCGQCFTFSSIPPSDFMSGIKDTWHGWAQNHTLTISQFEDGSLLFHNTSVQEFESFWKNYFDLQTDYTQIKAVLSQDDILQNAISYAPGIRILRQNGWEALCCFIISQNNNIKRIKGIVERLCQNFGEKLDDGSFSFPSPQVLAKASAEELAPLRCGFRAKYLIDAAQKVSSGEVDLAAVPSLPLAMAKEELMKIFGVGPKVADCVLLYGFYRLECCPMDVWMKRVFSHLYPNGLPSCCENHIGIAQQYLFHYARTCPDVFPPEEKPKKVSRKKQEVCV